MLFTDSQLEEYRTNGYVIIDCPFPDELTEDCMRAVRKTESPEETYEEVGKGNHFRLKPQVPESYWCDLDHSLAFLKIILHPEIVELARQVEGHDDLYLRNGGINEMPPGKSIAWHRDGGGPEWAEFMHYFAGGSVQNGCLRVVPGTHVLPNEELDSLLEKQREQQGVVMEKEGLKNVVDAELPSEVSLEVEPHQLIVRSSQIFHATWRNNTSEGRLMSHWLFRVPSLDNHRIRFDDFLTDELIDELTQEQKEVLWLRREFDICERYESEREMELGNVSWGVV